MCNFLFYISTLSLNCYYWCLLKLLEVVKKIKDFTRSVVAPWLRQGLLACQLSVPVRWKHCSVHEEWFCKHREQNLVGAFASHPLKVKQMPHSLASLTSPLSLGALISKYPPSEWSSLDRGTSWIGGSEVRDKRLGAECSQWRILLM